MALRMFVAKPGGGKSYGALLDILEELLWGIRVVVTNLAIDLGKLNEYIQRHHPDANVDLHARLLILTKEETKRFWLRRGPNVFVPDVTKEQERRGEFPDFGAYRGEGCLYVIDEAHIPFDAREWMNSGQSLTYYNSQHRKLNDELIFITQFLELIDKRVKGFAQEYWYFRNNGMEKLFTYFVLPEYFTARVYQRPPTGMHDLPSEVHRYRLNKALASCYDTSAGVGISGRQKPEEHKRKGLPIAYIAVPAVLALAGLWWVPDLLARMALGTESGKKVQRQFEAKPADFRQDEGRAPDRPAGPSRVYSVAPLPAVWALGYVVRGEKFNVPLSDGRLLVEGDIVEATRAYIVATDGMRYYFRQGGLSSSETGQSVPANPGVRQKE